MHYSQVILPEIILLLRVSSLTRQTLQIKAPQHKFETSNKFIENLLIFPVSTSNDRAEVHCITHKLRNDILLIWFYHFMFK